MVALAVVSFIRLALWIAPFRRVRTIVDGLASRPPGRPDPTPGDADRIAWAIRTAARFVPRATCLTQALAAEVLLGRSGHPADVRLGVARDEDGGVEAHAWVESYGRVVLGDEDLHRYAPFEPASTRTA